MIKVVKKGKKRNIAVSGDLTIYNALEFRKQLADHLSGVDELNIDLSEVSELDTAGVQILALAKRKSEQLGFSMHMDNHSVAVLEVLNIYNMVRYFGDPVVISQK